MQYYFDKEEHNFKTGLLPGNSKANFWPHKRTKECENCDQRNYFKAKRCHK